MARKLPWLSTSTKNSTDGTRSPTTPQNSRRPKIQPVQSDREENDAPDAASTSLHNLKAARERLRTARNSSSSPPPSPPLQEFMRAGLEQDDSWVMVEDEFLSTAHLYTSHLHKAEYLRLKKLARAQSASAIQSIARPVDNRTEQNGESRKKMEGAQRRGLGLRAVKNLEGKRRAVGRRENEDEDENEDPWLKDPRLAGLMTQRESSSQLSRITGAKSRTRASAGYAQVSQSQGVIQQIQEDVDSRGIPRRRTLWETKIKTATEAADEDEDEEDEEDSDDLGALSSRHSRYSKPSPPPPLPPPPPPPPPPRITPASKPETSGAPSRKVHAPTTYETSSSNGNRANPFQSSKSTSSTENIGSKPSITLTTIVRDTGSSLSQDLNDFDGLPQRRALSNRIIGRIGKTKRDATEVKGRKRSEEVPTFLF
ncbi:hypothetical protein FKW77_009417 [Venturia effusa]|uniref:Uncharacterized protein n=1 Tax=Venturia effusa TaxID=50376 RepID=A0A517LG97_9PEZI|nr:hypothetical protein FKW77_009417 [Venturia effusa]